MRINFNDYATEQEQLGKTSQIQKSRRENC